jgi:hypothetical protein
VADMEILGDDGDDRAVTDRPPVDPGATVWAPQSSGYRPGAPYDRSATGPDPQTGRTPAGTGRRPAAGGSSAALDLGEQARDPAWEQVWNTGPIPLDTVRVDPVVAGDAAAGGDERDAREARERAATGIPGPRPVPAPQPEPAPPAGPRALLVGTVASAESLSVAGVLVAVTTAISSFPSLYAFVGGSGGPREQYEAFAMTFALGGLIAAALGVAACLRLKPDTHPLVRGLAGGAVILGVLLVVLAAFTTIQAGDLPSPEGTDFEGSA